MIHLGLERFVPYILYVGGIAVFLISASGRTTVGVYLLVLTLPIQTVRYRLHDLPLGNKYIDIILLGIVIGLVVREGGVRLRSPLAKLILLLTVAYYVSLWQGTFYLDAPLPISFDDQRFSDWKYYVEMFWLYLIVGQVIKDKRQVQILLVIMAITVLLINRGYHGTMSGRDLSRYSDQLREAGVLGHAGQNGFGSFQVMMAAFFLGIAGYVKRLSLKLGILFVVASCVYAILFSFSREAYVAALAVMLLIGFLKERILLIVLFVVLGAWQAVLPSSVQERIMMTRQDAGYGDELDKSSQSRLNLWEDAIELFKSNPLFGIGFNTYEYLGRLGYGDTHNYYLKVLVETGIIGLFLFLCLLVKMWRLGYSLFRSAEDPFWASVGLGFLALICGATVLNFFGDRWTYQQLDGYLWILLGCVVRGLMITREQQHQIEVADADTAGMPVEMVGVSAA